MLFTFPRIYNETEEAIRGKPVDSVPKLYKQNSNLVPHLFVDQPERLSTKKWASLLAASPETYADCELVSLTWAKALESDLSHEFVQFIVEDKRHGVRTRVFSDRQKKGETDNVIVGWDWSGENNPSEQKDMPLPLKSLVFNDNNRPSVVALAQVLAAVTARAPDYSFFRMCFWYARSVFETAKAVWGGEVKEWPFSRYAYHLVLWDFDFMNKYEMENSARGFKKQNIEGMSYQVPGTVYKPEFKTEKYLSQVGAMLKDEDVQKDYEEALRVDGTEKVDPEMLKTAIESVQANATETNVHALEDKQAAKIFAEGILAEPDSDENLAAFEDAWQRNMRAEKEVPADDQTKFIRTKEFYFGKPSQQEKQDFDRAMECFVGGVLRLLDESSSNLPSEAQRP